MRPTHVAMLAMTLLVASCATPYGQRGWAGGYSDEKIDETHYRVTFDGNGKASADRVWAFWLYRCAELTTQKGYTHFTLRKPDEPLARWDNLDPAPSSLRPAAYRAGADEAALLKTRSAGAPVFIYTPGATVTTYHSDAVVGFHRDPLPEGLVVFKAQVMLDELGPYVKSDGQTPLVDRMELLKKAATMKRPQRGYSFGGEL